MRTLVGSITVVIGVLVWGIVPMISHAGTSRPCGDGYIELNTKIPFVGQCIKKTADPSSDETTAGNAFWRLLGSMMKIAMTVVLVVAFIAILVGGVMIAAGGIKSDWLSWGKWLIVKVIFWLLLLGASWVILNLINPNFFKTESGAWLILWTLQLF